jgi:hypothetical protein
LPKQANISIHRGSRSYGSFQIKTQTLEKLPKQANIPYILAFHLKIDADSDPVPDPAYHFDVDPDPVFYLMRIRMRIMVTK